MNEFTLGFSDGINNAIAVSIGLSFTNISKDVLLIAIISQIIGGSISMSLSYFQSLDTFSYILPLYVFFGYIVGGLIIISAYYITDNLKNGFTLSIVFNIVSLILLGYFRAYFLNQNIIDSIQKSLTIGIIALIVTYYTTKLIS